ncbi:unnamed protein product [Symbiodinium microadriaticum]|nr:unnamed protein product [Symbiodinium microadriaticum]
MPWAVVPSTASEDDVRAAAEVAKMSLSHFQSLMQPEQLDPSSDAAHVAPPEEEGGWWLVLAWQTGHWNLADDVAGAFNESQAAGRGEQDGSDKKPSVQAKYLQGYCPSAGAKVVTFGADHTEEDSEATTTQPPDLAAENAAKNALSQNVCPYRYYATWLLGLSRAALKVAFEELRLLQELFPELKGSM